MTLPSLELQSTDPKTQSTTATTQSTNAPNQRTGYGQAADNALRKAELSVMPGVRSTVVYTTNANLTTEKRSGRFILEGTPYVGIFGTSPRRQIELYAALRNFYNFEQHELRTAVPEANGQARWSLNDSWLWLDGRVRITNVSSNPFGALTFDPALYGTNVVTIKQYEISPFIKSELPRLADYELRYRLRLNSQYGTVFPKNDQRVSTTLNSGQRLGRWNTGYYGEYQRREFDGGAVALRRYSGLTNSYLVTQDLRLGAIVAWEAIDGLASKSGKDRGIGPGLFFDWAPSQITQVRGTVTRPYYGTTGNFQLYNRSKFHLFSVLYDKSVLSSNDSSLFFFDATGAGTNSGATPTTAAALRNQLYTQAVLQYGLTPFDLSLVTSSLVYDRRASANAGLLGPRNSLIFSVFDNQRESISSSESTVSSQQSGIRGSFGAPDLNGLYTLRGFTAQYDHSLDATTKVVLGFRRSASNITGTVPGFAAPGKFAADALSLQLRTRLTTDVTSAITLRRTNTHVDRSGTPQAVFLLPEQVKYDVIENAIIGSIDVRF